MAKKRTIDPGLQYLFDIGFDRIRSVSGLHDRFVRLFGNARANQIFEQRHNIPDGSLDFYEFKNSDPEISKGFSELYDGDIIRKACNYIESHKERFGNTILEVGCESGYMTGFLAKTFPNARIVAIDRSKAAVDMALRRITLMGVQNIEFRVASLGEVEEQYDTVFCMRTLQENWNSQDALYIGEPIISQFIQYAALTEEYSELLVSHIKENGTLCAFERVGHNPLMCGWMMSLCDLDCAPDLDTYAEVECEEVGDKNIFQAFICQKGLTEDPQRMIELWYNAIAIDPTGKGVLHDWNALCYLSKNAGRLIRGIRILNNENEQVGRFAAFEDKDGAPLIYYLNAAGEEITLFSFNKNDKDNALKHIQEAIDLNTKAGLHYEEIDSNDEFLEGN